jgi:hypothetical protein
MPAYTINPLVTAIAINTGGRNGHSETTDHSVSVNLSVRKEMGGPGLPDTTTPEHLFAAGCAACFGGAIEFVARQHRKDVTGTIVTGRRDARKGLFVQPCDAWKHRVLCRRQRRRRSAIVMGGSVQSEV